MFFSMSPYPLIYYFGVRLILSYCLITAPWSLWKLYKERRKLTPWADITADQRALWRCRVALTFAPLLVAWTCYWVVEKDIFYKAPGWMFIPLCFTATIVCFAANHKHLTKRIGSQYIWRVSALLVFTVGVSAFIPWGLPLYVYKLVFAETFSLASSVHWLLSPALAAVSFAIWRGTHITDSKTAALYNKDPVP